MSDKNILILAEQYPPKDKAALGVIYVKAQVDGIKKYFNKVIVVSAVPYLPSFLKKIKYFKKFIPSSLSEDYKYDNVEVYYSKFFTLPINFFRHRNAQSFYKATNRCIKKNNLKFDLIHSHFAWMPGYAGTKLKDRYKVPHFVTVHGSTVRIALNPKLQPPTFEGEDILLKKNLDYVFNSADAIITNHPELHELIIKNYDKKIIDKLHILDKEVDLDFFDPTDKENAEKLKKEHGIEKTFNVLFLTSITQNKDPMTFVNAAIKLQDLDTRFIMVGDGMLLNQIINMKTEQNIENLIIAGYQKNVPDWFLASNIFCALDKIENIWAGAVQEALCLGIPLIVVNTQQVAKHLKHNINAYIIPAGDSDSLVSAIVKLKKEPKILKRLSNNREAWRRRFDSKKIAKDLMDIYMKVKK